MRPRIESSLTIIWISSLLIACTSNSGDAPVAESTSTTEQHAMPSQSPTPAIYELDLHTLDGKEVTLDAYRGRAMLIVNVASKCGLTPQYTQLEALQAQYGERGLTVIGFPCNQFGGQEPGSPAEIQTFCSTQYGVSFPLMEKLEVNGPDRHQIYQVLTQVPDATGAAGDVQWNFEKFVVSADGKSITRFRPRTTPDDPEVITAIESALPKS